MSEEFKLKRRPFVVYNNNPKGSKPIVIVADWCANQDPRLSGVPTTTFMISPGDGFDLNQIGLDTIRKSK